MRILDGFFQKTNNFQELRDPVVLEQMRCRLFVKMRVSPLGRFSTVLLIMEWFDQSSARSILLNIKIVLNNNLFASLWVNGDRIS